MISGRPCPLDSTRACTSPFWPLRNQRIAFLIYCYKSNCNESNTMRCSIKTAYRRLLRTQGKLRAFDGIMWYLFLFTQFPIALQNIQSARVLSALSRDSCTRFFFFAASNVRRNSTAFSSIKPILFSTRISFERISNMRKSNFCVCSRARLVLTSHNSPNTNWWWRSMKCKSSRTYELTFYLMLLIFNAAFYLFTLKSRVLLGRTIVALRFAWSDEWK